jgi:hypothetical protein
MPFARSSANTAAVDVFSTCRALSFSLIGAPPFPKGMISQLQLNVPTDTNIHLSLPDPLYFTYLISLKQISDNYLLFVYNLKFI